VVVCVLVVLEVWGGWEVVVSHSSSVVVDVLVVVLVVLVVQVDGSQSSSVLVDVVLVSVLVLLVEVVVQVDGSQSSSDVVDDVVLVVLDVDVLVVLGEVVLLVVNVVVSVFVVVALVVVQSVAATMAQLVAQPRPLHCSWHGNFRWVVAGGFGQPQPWVTVLRTRHAGTAQVRHCSAVDVMVGQPVTEVGGPVMVVVWWLSVAVAGAMLYEVCQRMILQVPHKPKSLTTQP
jgi:hypothetical protein